MTHKTFHATPLLATASAFALLTAVPAFAQTPPAAEDAAVIDDIVVTGTRALSGFRGWWTNSTAEHIVRNAGLPVFIVPPELDDDEDDEEPSSSLIGSSR